MIPNTERFTSRVADYVKYRPSYPSAAIDFIFEAARLTQNSTIADIGAGTGISTKIFAERGLQKVYAVEPNAAMRAAMRDFLRDFENVEIVEGTAEATNLPAETVELIVAAQAFHWFDRRKFRAEAKRISRKNGLFCLIWNERDLQKTAFLRDYERLLLEFGTDYEQTRHDNIGETELKDFFSPEVRKAVFENIQKVDFEGLQGRLLSSSYTPSAQDARFAPMIERLKQIFQAHRKDDAVEILYNTRIYLDTI